jgi:hypothetical protein
MSVIMVTDDTSMRFLIALLGGPMMGWALGYFIRKSFIGECSPLSLVCCITISSVVVLLLLAVYQCCKKKLKIQLKLQ